MGSFGAPSGPQSSLCQATVIVKPAGPVFLVLVRVVRAGLAGQVKGFAGLHEKGVNRCSFRGWIACGGGITKLVQERRGRQVSAPAGLGSRFPADTYRGGRGGWAAGGAR